MTLLAPVWLWLLLPWAAACLWAGRRAKTAAGVPFVHLWPRVTVASAARRGWPPAWLVCLLLAVLFCILAAAGPAFVRKASAVVLIVDRSPALTPARLKATEAMLNLPESTVRRVVPIPGEPFDVAGPVDWNRVAPTALSNEISFTALQGALTGPAILISDRSIELRNDGHSIQPPEFQNAGIDAFGLTMLPLSAGAQAMVRVFNGTSQTRGMLRVDQVKVSIDLPAFGQSRDYFIDLPAVGQQVEAELLSADGRAWEDDVEGDDIAFLVRGGRPAKIEATEGLAEDLRRMITVYERRRGSSAESPRVKIGRDPGDALAVVLPPIMPGDQGEVKIDVGHPITRAADLSAVKSGGRSVVPLAGDGWRVLIRAENAAPLLAVRESPARQVWVGFDTGVLADRPDYVIFWTDVFDWLAGAGGFAAEPVRSGLTPVRVADEQLEASPGLYTDGVRQIATFMPAVRPVKHPSDPRAIRPAAFSETHSLSAWPLSIAVVCFAVGLGLYRSLTRF